MRQLVIDVGNTSTAMGLWTEDGVTKIRHIDGSIAEAEKAAEKLLRYADQVAYVSVVPNADRVWKAWAKRERVPFHVVTYRDFPHPIDYDDPRTIGADRLADAAAAIVRYGTRLIVMDFGTAFTAAVITDDGVWRGGAIAPGFPLMRDYLFERTAKLPRLKFGNWQAPKIGRSTIEAMRFGALVGYRGIVHEIVDTFRRNFGCDFELVATGGYARWVIEGWDDKFLIDPDLTLYGAGILAAR